MFVWDVVHDWWYSENIYTKNTTKVCTKLTTFE
jgi:hypothetical protein